MSLLERITQALEGASDWPWNFNPTNGEITDAYVQHVASARTLADGRLIAAAPGLLAECAQRLTPTEDVQELVADLRRMDEQESARDGCHWGRYGPTAILAADLLAQVFLDPQETK